MTLNYVLWLNESVHPSFAPRYVELAQENHEYLSQWLSWPYFCKTEAEFNAFIQHSLHNYAFSHLNMNKVEISAAVDNAASRAVCERLGMGLEGVITNAEKVGDRIFTHAIYGLHKK
jgi:ribosomal-protein-serine acetyltransferase